MKKLNFYSVLTCSFNISKEMRPFIFLSFKPIRGDLMTHRILIFQSASTFNPQKILWSVSWDAERSCRRPSFGVWVCQFTIATSDDTRFPPSHDAPRRVSTIHLYTRHPLCAIDIYGAIYILPNILSLGKWPQARAKLLNIQAGNEAKFVCVSARFRHWYTSGSSSSALLPDCILSRDGIILQHTVTRTCWHVDLRLRSVRQTLIFLKSFKS